MSNVMTDEIKKIKPGATEAFHCDSSKMYSIATMLTTIQRRDLPEGVVGYEHKKLFDKDIIIIRALREGDEKMLNR